MRVAIEGEKYEIHLLKRVFGNSALYNQQEDFGIITHVGYFHSFVTNEIVYLLPKVFILNVKVFGIYTPNELFEDEFHNSIKKKSDYNWVRQLSILFYTSLKEFKRKYFDSSIIETNQSLELNSNIGKKEYSYLDLVLSFVNFYKKNKSTILFRHIETISNSSKKTNWTKTAIKTTPLIDSDDVPIYTMFAGKKKIKNDTEELLCYFISIVSHFNKQHQLHLSIDKSYKIITGKAFEQLQKNGIKHLKRIKYRYFADILKRIYHLCELYFSLTDLSSTRKKNEEFLLVRNYNIVFEDMVDKLFSDQFVNEEVYGATLEDLKNNKDGKVIDHLYEYKSLIDTSNIFYIGDSKYYKSDTVAGQVSIYKQFTYAKNIIQFNIDLFNHKGYYFTPNVRYRDQNTEGYNISPNFFLYGFIKNLNDFDDPLLEEYKLPQKSYHFENRLFDRDTLFVHSYLINFLFVLKSYTTFNNVQIQKFRQEIRKKFRQNFINYFNNTELCGFILYEKQFLPDELDRIINTNFRLLNGKCIVIDETTLLIAKHLNDDSLNEILKDFKHKMLI